jgi:chromosome transmission fidelity protein 1
MLFCVMGGKLSEGINFSDDLARCVVVIGMPYPDGRDQVLQEKLKFADLVEGDAQAGKRLYEAMCMRTVNQCIGRAIRHVNDYATIVLLDRRYSQQRVRCQLPKWLSNEIHHSLAFHEIKSKLKNFFSSCGDKKAVLY